MPLRDFNNEFAVLMLASAIGYLVLICGYSFQRCRGRSILEIKDWLETAVAICAGYISLIVVIGYT